MRALVVVTMAMALGCNGVWRQGGTSATPSGNATLAEADAEALAGRQRNALPLYEAIVKEHPGEEVAARALHGLAIIRFDPRSPVRDRRLGLQNLTKLSSEYPNTSWGREARLWRLLLREIDRCEAEATQLGADADRLRQTLDSLRDSDLELETKP
jgi:hypothetical protein